MDDTEVGHPRATLLYFSSLVLVFAGAACERSAQPERIVLIVIDTLRRDHLGVYGATIPTPNIDRLAADGTVFRRPVSSFHNTSMSMGALFTGHTPSLESGVAGQPLVWNARNWCGLARFAGAEDDACVPRGLRSLGEVMRGAGYWTLGVTPHPLMFRPFGFERGFDEWVEIEAGQKTLLAFREETQPKFAALRSGGVVNAAVADALRRRPHDRFFLYTHYLDVHDWHLRRVSYERAVRDADAAVGELLEHLESLGLLEGAVVIVTSDHGEALEEKHVLPTTLWHIGNPSYEQVLRVPLIVSGVRLDEEADDLVRTEDIFWLLARLAASTTERAAKDLRSEELFVTERYYRTYRSGRWKSFWRRHDGVFRLVDLEADPGELHDVAAAHPDIVEAHQRRSDELTASLAASGADTSEISPEDVERLRVLGYMDSPHPAP